MTEFYDNGHRYSSRIFIQRSYSVCLQPGQRDGFDADEIFQDYVVALPALLVTAEIHLTESHQEIDTNRRRDYHRVTDTPLVSAFPEYEPRNDPGRSSS